MNGMNVYPIPYIVEFTWDNGAVFEDMRAVCMAFDEDDARAIIHSKYSTNNTNHNIAKVSNKPHQRMH